MPQFESSHTYAYIFPWGAAYNILKQQTITLSKAPTSANKHHDDLTVQQMDEQIDIDLGY